MKTRTVEKHEWKREPKMGTVQTKDIGNKNQSNKNKKEYRAKDKQNCKT